MPARHHGGSILAALTVAALTAAGLSGCVQYATALPVVGLPSLTPSPTTVQAPAPVTGAASLADPWLLLSMEEDGNAHLFAYQLASGKLTRLTSGDWNDITPSLSPDGHWISFASDRAGFWDLYTMDLGTALASQVTDTPEYDGSPVWSPDMAWMAYETYNEGQLDIVVRSTTDPTAAPVLLTDNPASDHSPSWSPDGRQIAFVSNRTGDADIWIADLDKASDRFTNLTRTPRAAEDHPTWSHDGTRLAWGTAAQAPASSGIYVWDASGPNFPATWIGSGAWPAWNADDSQLAATMDGPTQQLLGAYALAGTPLILPATLPGRIRGLNWSTAPMPDPLPDDFLKASQLAAPGMRTAPVTSLPEVPSERWHIVPLEGVQLSSAGLHALVAPLFEDLRARVISEAGWDPLASLENTFVPLTTPLDPGLEQDWLYTGRAIAINPLMLNAGWMSVLREDYSDQTFWRVYVRVRDQDGSQGVPISAPPWDLNGRYQLSPEAYEAGGGYGPVPTGYWLDLTSLAEAYGWHRLAALPSWRTYYAGARFSEFAQTGGLDWHSAMLELYPADALFTATPLLPPTITPSRTPRPTFTPTATWTPRPTNTPPFTSTPSLTPTPAPPTSTPPPTPTPPTIIPTFPSPTP